MRMPKDGNLYQSGKFNMLETRHYINILIFSGGLRGLKARGVGGLGMRPPYFLQSLALLRSLAFVQSLASR